MKLVNADEKERIMIDGEAFTLEEVESELEDVKRKRDETFIVCGYYEVAIDKAKKRAMDYQNRYEKLAEARDALRG